MSGQIQINKKHNKFSVKFVLNVTHAPTAHIHLLVIDKRRYKSNNDEKPSNNKKSAKYQESINLTVRNL